MAAPQSEDVIGTLPGPQPPKWRDPETLRTVVFILVGAAAAWYLMLQLASVLRPLLVAVFLAYVLMPYHSRLRKRVGTPASIALLVGSTAGVLVLLAFITYVSILELSADTPALEKRAKDLSAQAEAFLKQNAPWLEPMWLGSTGQGQIGPGPTGQGQTTQDRINDLLKQVARPVLDFATGAVLEACVVGLYLLFLLLGSSRLPDRIRSAYTPERAEEIMKVAGAVNAAIISYLKAKVKSSLILAVPVGLVLLIAGVKFWLLWMVLTFLCNFIPYIGSVIAYTMPVGFAFLWFGPATWQPYVAAGLLLACHVGTATIAEPMILGSAVGVSPLVILASLSFWGLAWGIPGMLLSIPLTVVASLVLDQFEQTRAIARLIKGG